MVIVDLPTTENVDLLSALPAPPQTDSTPKGISFARAFPASPAARGFSSARDIFIWREAE